MKKVFSTLVLTSLLAVLLVPVMALALDNCQNWVCQGTVGNVVPCNCGTQDIANTRGTYCCGSCSGGAGAVFTTPAACQAAMSGGTTPGGGGQITTIPGLIAKITQIGDYIFDALLVIAGIFLVVSGYFFVTAGGNPENVNKARQMLINALIGVAVGVAAKGLVLLVQNFVGP